LDAAGDLSQAFAWRSHPRQPGRTRKSRDQG